MPTSGDSDLHDEARAGRASRRVVISIALIVAASPLLLLLPNRDWFFTSEEFLDPWVYVGYFYQYTDWDYRADDYKLARLPWILSGFVVTKLFTPVTAAYVLHVVFLCATPLALFAVMQLLFRRSVLAAVTAMCLGFYTHAHGSGGWDYHNTSSGAFYLAAVAPSVLPLATQGHRLVLLAVGVMAAVTVHNNIIFANLLPSLVFVHLRVAYLRGGALPPLRTLVVRAAWAIAGALLATVLLGLVNVMVGRPFLFFLDLASLLERYLTDEQYQAGRPLSIVGWILSASHLAVVAAVFVTGVVCVVAARRQTRDTNGQIAEALVVQFLPLPLLWAVWQAVGHTALDWNYMAYALIPSCFLALGGLLHRGWPMWCERHWVTVPLGSAAVLTMCLAVEQLPGVQRLAALMQPFMLVGGALILLLPLLAYFWRPSAMSAMCLVAIFAVDNRLLGGQAGYFATDRCKTQPAIYGAVVEAASWVMKVDPFYNRTRIWFDVNELIYPMPGCPVRMEYMTWSLRTVASSPFVTRDVPMPDVEGVPDKALIELTGDTVFVIVTNNPAHLDAWNHRLDALGLTYSEIESHRVPVLAAGFVLHAWTVTRKQ